MTKPISSIASCHYETFWWLFFFSPLVRMTRCTLSILTLCTCLHVACVCVCLCLGGSGGREQAEHENQTDAKADPTPGRGENHRETNTPMWCADTHWTSLIHHFTWTKPCTVQCFCCSPKFTWWYFIRRNIGDWIYLFVVSSTSCLVLMQTLSDADKKQLLNFDYVHISTMVNLNMSTSQEEIRSSNIHMTGHSSPPHAKSPVIAVLASLMQFSYMREYFHPGSIY